LLALLLTLPAFERLRQRGRASDWGLYALLAVIASQLHYLNIVLVGGQLVALLILSGNRRRVMIGGACTALAVAAALGPFMLGVHTSGLEWASWRAPQATLALGSTLQTMAAGDARIAPAAARAIALIVVGLGAALALLERHDWPLLLPHLLQIAFALLVAFVLLPLAGVPAPAYEERPFLLVLPSALFCFSVGMRRLAARGIGRLLAAGLIVALGATSLAGLASYYSGFVKSPEALTADQIAERAHPGDIALGDAYSVDAALRFYHPELLVYYYRRERGGRAVFLANNTVLTEKPPEQLAGLGELTRSQRIWLIQGGATPRPYAAELQSRYETRETLQVPPFRAILLERSP